MTTVTSFMLKDVPGVVRFVSLGSDMHEYVIQEKDILVNAQYDPHGKTTLDRYKFDFTIKNL